MSKRRMDAYYYGFDATGSETIDKILGAVACAGKSSHHTENWDEEACVYDDHTGKTPTEWIQNAAMEAADELERLNAENSRLREALQNILDVYGDDLPGKMAQAALAEKEEK